MMVTRWMRTKRLENRLDLVWKLSIASHRNNSDLSSPSSFLFGGLEKTNKFLGEKQQTTNGLSEFEHDQMSSRLCWVRARIGILRLSLSLILGF